jgi:hypothetical protein
MLVPHENLSDVVASPFRLTDLTSTKPGVAETASSIGSAMNRDTSSAAAPGYRVRIVKTGSSMSGNNDTGSLPNDTDPSSTKAATADMVVTGRFSA